MAIATQTLVTAVKAVCVDGQQVLRELTNVPLAGQVSMRLVKIGNQFEKLGETEIAVLCREPAKVFQMFIEAAQRPQPNGPSDGMVFHQAQFSGILQGQLAALQSAVDSWAAVREK